MFFSERLSIQFVCLYGIRTLRIWRKVFRFHRELEIMHSVYLVVFVVIGVILQFEL